MWSMRPSPWLYGLALVPLLFLSGSRSAAQAPATPGFENTVQPLFAKNCMGCHNPTRKTGGLDLEPFKTAVAVLEHRDAFEKIVRRLNTGEMPPKGSPRPDALEVKAATSWLEAEFDRADLSAKPAMQVLARRLNRTEYNNTIRDLLGIRSGPADEFPPDDSALGFDNIAQALAISPSLMEKYLATAERLAREAVFGPRAQEGRSHGVLPAGSTADGVHQPREGGAPGLLHDVRLRRDRALAARLAPPHL